ncbi:MAG: hypothetical protein ACI4BD_05150 [Paludibacteraceae bacterium]
MKTIRTTRPLYPRPIREKQTLRPLPTARTKRTHPTTCLHSPRSRPRRSDWQNGFDKQRLYGKKMVESYSKLRLKDY